jgi:hypothetical protein
MTAGWLPKAERLSRVRTVTVPTQPSTMRPDELERRIRVRGREPEQSIPPRHLARRRQRERNAASRPSGARV